MEEPRVASAIALHRDEIGVSALFHLSINIELKPLFCCFANVCL